MSITDELREAINELRVGCEEKEGCGVLWYPEPSRDRFSEIADRIDAEHEKAEQDLIDANNQMEQLCECSIGLPVDADGEYIHIGDELDGYNKTIEVVELRYGRSGWVLISRDGNGCADTFAFTHHHAPTVEDVLREFADEVWNRCCEGATASDSGIDELVAEYAAKLRLAGEDA